MKPSDIKRGHVIRWQNDLWRVVGISHVQKGNWRSYYQIDLKNLKTGRVLTNRFATHEDIEYAEVDQRKMQYLYRDGNHHCFMDSETFEQVMIPHDEIADQVPFLKLNMELVVQFVEGQPVSIDLPASVVLEVIETTPGVKGDTVSNVTKPAKLETGLEVKVPLHINAGDQVKVDTRTGEFIERASAK